MKMILFYFLFFSCEPKLGESHCIACSWVGWEQSPLKAEYLCSLSSAQCKRLEGGLDKLKEATIQLDELNQKLAEQKIVLAEKSAACEALLEEIATNTAIGKCGASSGDLDCPLPTKKPQTGQGSIAWQPWEATCRNWHVLTYPLLFFFWRFIFFILIFWLHWVFTMAHRLSPVVVREPSCPAMCRILVPWPGIKPTSPALEGRLWTAGPPWKSQSGCFKTETFMYSHCFGG